MVVHGLLESSGIDSDVTSLDAQQDILPGVGGTVILVREEDADEARRVIRRISPSPGHDTPRSISVKSKRARFRRTRPDGRTVQKKRNRTGEIGPVGQS